MTQRILMTGDTIGGVWTYCIELARSLQAYGVRITLATMGQQASPAQRQQAASLANLDLIESEWRLEWMDDPWADVEHAGEWLREIEARVQPDIVHLNGFAHGALNWSAPCLVVAHSCVLSWWRAVRNEAAPAAWNQYRVAVSRGLQGATFVAAPTQAMLETLEENYSCDLRGRKIFNACAPGPFRCQAKEPFILTAGRLWDEAKNIASLAAIADDLPWPVRAAGEGSGAGGKLDYLGFLSAEAIAREFAAASIYALPARYEPFGLSALEAAHAGCALVLGDIPSLREVWQDAALYVPPDRPDVLRRVLQQLIDDPLQRQQWSDRARQRAATFTPERMANVYMELYREMLTGVLAA